MDNPLVSVLLPTYNRAYCIERTVDSALTQTYANIEVVLVDDGSTDSTKKLIESRYGNDQRVRYFHQSNSGVSIARNAGLRNVRGDFVALLDSDDIWKPWKIELQLACLQIVPHAGMIWTDMEAIRPEGQVTDSFYLRKYYSAYQWFTESQLFTEQYPLPEISVQLPPSSRPGCLFVGDIFSQMIMGNLVHTPTVLIRRDRLNMVGFFNENLKRSGGDFDFHLRTCHAGPVAFINQAAIQYRIGDADQLTQPCNAYYSSRNFLSTILPFIENEPERIRLPDEMIDKVLGGAHQWIGRAAFDMGQFSEARSHFWQSFQHKRWDSRTIAFYAASLLPACCVHWLRIAFGRIKGMLIKTVL